MHVEKAALKAVIMECLQFAVGKPNNEETREQIRQEVVRVVGNHVGTLTPDMKKAMTEAVLEAVDVKLLKIDKPVFG